MKKRLVNLFTLASASLVLFFSIEWCRGYFIGDDLMLIRRSGPSDDITIWTFWVSNLSGTVIFEADRRIHRNLCKLQINGQDANIGWSLNYGALTYEHSQVERAALRSVRFGGGYFSERTDRGGELVVPAWLIVLVASAVPLIQFIQLVRKLRQKKIGHCICCGYDLRASPDRCPECGGLPST